jgi:hypothetical protein
MIPGAKAKEVKTKKCSISVAAEKEDDGHGGEGGTEGEKGSCRRERGATTQGPENQ